MCRRVYRNNSENEKNNVHEDNGQYYGSDDSMYNGV